MGTIVVKYKRYLLYGFSLAVLLLGLHWLEYRLIVISHAFEMYAGMVALLFMGLGIWLALKLYRPKKETIIIEKEIAAAKPFARNEDEQNRLGISNREMEVLILIAEGRSNNEIATQLFVSLNTIKTHSSKLFEKLEASRRTQAVEKAKRIGLIP